MTTIVIAGPDPAVARAVAEGLADDGSPALLVPADPGGRLAAFRAEPTDEGSIRAAVDRAATALGAIGAAVVLPGSVPDRPIDRLDDELWRLALDANLTAAMHVTRAVAPRIVEAGGGPLAFVTWRAEPGVGRSHVAAAAGAVGMLARALAVELGSAGVRSNAVAVPPGRVADAVPALRLLLSAEIGYLTGEVLELAGGPA